MPTSVIDRSINTTKDKLAANPNNINLLVVLCQNYLQKVRETADPEYYTKCDELLSRAVALEPNNAQVVATQSALAYGRHNFPVGLALAQKAVTLNPNKVAYYGLVGDGQIELGKYPEAVASFQTMVDKRPDLSAYNRVAYAREIYDDISGAETALKSAVSAGSSYPENVAYSQVELGKLYARTNLGQAEQLFNQALYTYEDFPPALEGLGKLSFARSDYQKAISYFDKAFTALPLAQYAVDLADTYQSIGNSAKAKQQYYLADLAFQKASAGGVNNDYEKAVYLTNHKIDLQTANSLSRKATVDRPNIFSFDGLAWNLYMLGDYTEAQSNINTALGSGTNIPIILYHAGMIAAKQGLSDEAKAYFQKASAADNYFLESHFSLLDKKLGDETLKGL